VSQSCYSEAEDSSIQKIPVSKRAMRRKEERTIYDVDESAEV